MTLRKRSWTPWRTCEQVANEGKAAGLVREAFETRLASYVQGCKRISGDDPEDENSWRIDRRKGWLWVEILPAGQYPELGKFGRLPAVHVPLAPDVRAEIETLEREQEQLSAAHEDCEEHPKNVEQRLSAIEDRLDELNDGDDRAEVYREEDKKFAGAVVSLENNGEPLIYRGLVRAEDKKTMRASTSGRNGENSGIPNGDEADESALSAALVEDLTAYRTAALRVVLARRPDVALVAVAHSLALRVCYERWSYQVGSALSLSSEKGGCQLDSHAKGIATSIPSVTLEEVRSEWLSRIPPQPQDLWQWLLSQEQAVVIDFLAFCVGQTVHAVRLNHCRESDPCLVAADRLAEAVNLDMADWWKATGESYFARVKKEQILAAIEEGTGKTEDLEALRKLKKSELVATAEARLVETRWLPEILRR